MKIFVSNQTEIENGPPALLQEIETVLTFPNPKYQEAAQSLYKCAAELAPHIGFLVVDECYWAPSRIFTEAVKAFDCRYMLGLSATPWRRDGLSRVIWWHLGDKVFEIDKGALIDTGAILPARLIVRETGFTTSFDASAEYSSMLSELIADQDRNDQIALDVSREVEYAGGGCLVLSDRKSHCELLREAISRHGISAEILTGDVSVRKRRRIVEDVGRGEVPVLIATSALIGEGFDCPGLSTLFLATPMRFSGRVLRPATGKSWALVYDYVDRNVGVLEAAATARQRIIKELKNAA